MENINRLQITLSNANHRRNEAMSFLQNQELRAFDRSIMESIMWITNALEWFEKNANHILKTNLDRNNTKQTNTGTYNYLLGYKQIFNSFKHNMKIHSLDEFNYDAKLFGISLQQPLWVSSTLLEDKNNMPAAFASYQENLEGKHVLITLQDAITKLNELYFLYKKDLEKIAQN